ncbi:MAG: desulfoferrodoxin [Bacilli bacterium]|nr:desulfoferrodoxin [Bacilli bacterium]
MEILTGNVNEEKHVPFIEELSDGYRVTIGKPAIHPMTDVHYIEFIELYVDGVLAAKKEFNPGDTPVAEFTVAKGKEVYAREFCNLHGLWQGEL